MINYILSAFGLQKSAEELNIYACDPYDSDKYDSSMTYLSSNPDEVLELPRELKILRLDSNYTIEKYIPSLEKLYEQLSQLPNLHTLDVYQCKNFSDKEFRHLSGLKNLKVLKVIRGTIDGSGIPLLPDSIEKLSIYVKPEFLPLLKELPKLESLWGYWRCSTS